MHKLNRWILPITLLALAATLVFFVFLQAQSRQESVRLQEISAEYDAKIRPLREEYTRLKKEIAELDQEIASAQGNYASALILCTEPDARMEENILSLLQNYEYTGVLAVSDAFFPGQDGCISLQTARELVGSGWDICLSVSGDTDVTALCRRVLDAGLSLPVALYCPVAPCSPSQAAAAKQLGITAIISHTREQANEDPELWYIPAYGSNESTSERMLDQTIADSDCLALSVGYQRERDRYEVNNYVAMIRVLSRHVTAGEIAVTDLVGARQRADQHAAALLEGSPELTEQKAQLEQKLAEVEQQMRRIG